MRTGARIRIRKARPRRRPRASSQSTRRKPPAPKLSGRPHVLVLGQNDLSARIVRSVRSLGVQCRRVGTPEDASAAVNELTKALLIVPPIPSVSVLTFAQRNKTNDRGVPVFVVMEGPLPTRTVGSLYQNGVEAVFEWPVDAQALKRTVFRLSAPELGGWGRSKSPAEIALEETARAHLNADAVPFGADFGVEASHRFVILKGSLDALWQLELARQIIAEIPGVDDVIAEGVEITGQAQEDRATAKAIREVLRQVRGVRRVHDYLVVSEKGKKQDKILARRVRASLRTRYPDIPIHLAVFGNVAVLSGRVPRAAIREQIKQLVSNQDGVERVVDKLSVSGRARLRR